MAKNNLVPEVRADRNGRMVTRHVKADTAGKGKASIPSPSQNAIDRKAKKLESDRLTEKMRRMLVELVRLGVDVIGEPQAQHNVHYLIKTDPALAREIVAHIATATDAERDIWIHELSFDHRTPADWQDETDYMQVYRRSMKLNPAAVLLAEPQPYSTHRMHFARSLIHDASEAASEHGRAGDMEWMKAVMLVSETHAKAHDMHRRKVDLSSLKDDIDFVQDNWEAVVPFIPELIRRQNATRGFITTLMTSGAASLSEGML